MLKHYDVIVIGAGHAGCEAAAAAARICKSVLLITMDMAKIAQMSCNPSIGGIAKGQLVREIDALGGYSAIVTDASTIQFRMLNKSKGPAMWSPRAQCDRMSYSLNWRYILENIPNLDLWQDTVASFSFSQGRVNSLTTVLGVEFTADAFVLTAGTFLNGKIFVGQVQVSGGRISEPSSDTLSTYLRDAGVPVGRMKTGTPPRIDIRSVNLDRLTLQEGDAEPEKFSFLPYRSPIQAGVVQMHCYIAHTNPDVHAVLRSAFHLSPLFSGRITGIGPRYCPSIEDKLRTFADKETHQLFLEPEGWRTNEYYLQGFSSSLPFDVQYAALRKIDGFERAVLYRPAYAIEYDYFDPTYLYPTLRSKVLDNLFLAGQVNGTTGYEEAAAQGLYAGINAAFHVCGKDPFVLRRDESYIGVLIDDLINKGVDEPYRLFTSRAEYRILLRQDNADMRLTPIAEKYSLADSLRLRLFHKKAEIQKRLADGLLHTKVSPDLINGLLVSFETSRIESAKSLSSLLQRPQLSFDSLYKFVPRGTRASISRLSKVDTSILDEESDLSIYVSLPFRPQVSGQSLIEASLFDASASEVEIEIKYSGYIVREAAMASKMRKLENLKIPSDFDFSKITSLSTEGRMKLLKHRPESIAQASRIPGVSPSDISVLLVYFGR